GELDRPLRARVVVELRRVLGRPYTNPHVPEAVQRALESETSPIATDDTRWIEDWYSERLSRASHEELAATLEATLDHAERHGLSYTGELVALGERLRVYGGSDIESVIIGWMRRQPSSARVEIA